LSIIVRFLVTSKITPGTAREVGPIRKATSDPLVPLVKTPYKYFHNHLVSPISIIVTSCRRQAAAAVILMTPNLRLRRPATQQQGRRKKFIKQQIRTSGSFDFPQLATPFGEKNHENGGQRSRNHHQFHQRAQSKPDYGYGDAAGGGGGISLSLMTTTTTTTADGIDKYGYGDAAGGGGAVALAPVAAPYGYSNLSGVQGAGDMNISMSRENKYGYNNPASRLAGGDKYGYGDTTTSGAAASAAAAAATTTTRVVAVDKYDYRDPNSEPGDKQ
jgi:hypothetical protein